jgi:DNA-binding transcriptional LysR family regulator
MDWSHLEYFLAVARTGSLSGAAKLLRVNHSTVARRLDKLEQQLEVRLFDRLNNGYRLTEDGHALKKRAGQVEHEINQIQGVFSGSEAELRGTLTISKPSSGLINLAPLLAAFHHRYPDINLVLTAGGERSEIARMEADVAIRLTNDPPEVLVGYKLGQLPINIFGSRAYLKQAGTRNLAEYDWLVWHDDNSVLNMEPALKRDIPNARIVLRTNSYNELFEAVNAGMGISLLSSLRLPKTHQLQVLSPELYQFDQGVWLLSHPDLRNRERIRVFKDFMIEHLGGALTKHWET